VIGRSQDLDGLSLVSLPIAVLAEQHDAVRRALRSSYQRVTHVRLV
jgi:hypothetical protein